MPPRIIAPAVMFLSVFLACIISVAALSCGGTNCADPKNGSSAACVAENALVECAGSDVAGAITQFTPAVEAIVQHGLNPDGSINYTSIEGDLITAVAKYGWCVVSAVFDHYIHPPGTNVATGSGSAVSPGSNVSTGSGSAVAAKLTGPSPTPAAAQDAFHKLRAKVAPQLKVHTAGGTL